MFGAPGRRSLRAMAMEFLQIFMNPAVIAILVFLIAIFALNWIEFGRPD